MPRLVISRGSEIFLFRGQLFGVDLLEELRCFFLGQRWYDHDGHAGLETDNQRY